jgi:GT2 family glycosyltransferase
MRNVIYSKYSLARKKEFRIATVIEKEDNGELYVLKRAASKEAVSHIKNVAENGRKLDQIFEGTDFSANKFEEQEGVLKFQHLTGRTLLDRTYSYLLKNDVDSVRDLLREYKSSVLTMYQTEDFVITDEFREIFGDCNLPDTVKAVRNLDIDMIFENLIEQDGKKNVIDYEWTFPFPIPVNYLFYRNIMYTFLVRGTLNGKSLTEPELCQMFEIFGDEVPEYNMMERNFQHYVVGDDENEDKPVRAISFREFTNGRAETDKIEIYYGREGEFAEDDKTVISVLNQGEIQTVDIPVPKGVTSMRVDPYPYECILGNVSLTAVSGGKESDIVYSSNESATDDDGLRFFRSDPQLLIEKIPEETDFLRFKYTIWGISPGMQDDLIEGVNDLKKNLAEKNASLNQLLNSKSWKITKPLRKALRVGKRIVSIGSGNGNGKNGKNAVKSNGLTENTEDENGVICIDYIKRFHGETADAIMIKGWHMPKPESAFKGEVFCTIDGSKEGVVITKDSREDVKDVYESDFDAGEIGFFIKKILPKEGTDKIKVEIGRKDGKPFYSRDIKYSDIPIYTGEEIIYCIDNAILSGAQGYVTGWVYADAVDEKSILADVTDQDAAQHIYEDVEVEMASDIAVTGAKTRRAPRRDLILPGRPDYLTAGFTIMFDRVKGKNYSVNMKAPGGATITVPLTEYNADDAYTKIREKTIATEDELKEQKQHRFDYAPLISVLVPIYKTDVTNMKIMIESVINQSYQNWELCLADGSADGDAKRKKVLEEYSKKNSRIKVDFLNENLGISGNSNAAAALASGEWIALLDHDDTLEPDALYEMVKAMQDPEVDMIYTDEDKTSGNRYFEPHFKSDFSLDYIRNNNYICHFFGFRKSMITEKDMFNKEFDGAQDYDLILRCSERARKIYHIQRIEYHWRAELNSTAFDAGSKEYAFIAGKNAIEAHLKRCNVEATVDYTSYPGLYNVKYPVKSRDLISIVIPTHEHPDVLKRCVDSILDVSTYDNIEIILVENGSKEPETFAYYDSIKDNPRIKIVTWDNGFNYSAINNYGVSFARGRYLLFLNNDIEAVTADWLEEMVSNLQRNENIGAVGVKLIFPQHLIQHAGVVIGIGGVAGHAFSQMDDNEPGYYGRIILKQDVSAVTAACLMTSREVYDAVGGFEEELSVAFNDIDFCLKIRKAGYRIIYDPDATLIHYESLSRGYETENTKKLARFKTEEEFMKKKWGEVIENGDPFYNPNLTLKRCDYSLKMD